ncbi:MAG TPA: class I SAM-dependent methyltransferase [Blastocatellia bacterium]|nr:class I SAM-dependent methyltransferase [Blastocatellia bacterium]
MGLYANHIFPRMLDWALGSPEANEQRQLTLAKAKGQVLEVGFGTGLNLRYYPEAVTKLTALDAENFRPEVVQKRIAKAPFPVEQVQLDAGGKLPFPDASFDTVVTTWTLCSIANVDAALLEMKRVLRPDGEFLFCEHGRSDDANTAAWQDRLNPLQKIVGCGCNMNRAMDAIIQRAGFDIIRLDRFVMKNAPRILGEMYRGVAQKA